MRNTLVGGFFDYDGAQADEPTKSPPETFLTSASESEWSLIFDYGSRHRFAAGDVVVESGEESRVLQIVLSGRLDVISSTGRRGRSRTIGVIEEGSVVGELGFIDGAPRTNTVIAASDAEVFMLDWEAFERLCSVRPTLGIQLLHDVSRILASRFRRAGSVN